MVGAKLKIIEETIYEGAAKKFAECGIEPSIARLIMKSVQCRFEEEAVSELSLKILKNKLEDVREGAKKMEVVQYLAVKGNSGIFLSNPSQIEKFLSNGCDIYEVYGDDSKKLLYHGRKTKGGM